MSGTVDLDKIRKLSPADGDVFCFPMDTPLEHAIQFRDALKYVSPGLKFTVVMGPVTHLSESKMRELGWKPL